MSEPEGDFASVESDGFTVTSSTETPEQLESNLAETPVVEPDLSKAGSELGKAGGAANAAKRRGEVGGPLGEAADPAESGAVPDGDGQPLGKARHDPKARMLEATRKEAEAKRLAAAAADRAERAERRLAELERAQAPQAPKEPPKPAGDAQPKVEDFEDYADFVEARARWAAREEFRSHQEKAAQQTYKAAEQQAIEGYKSKFSERLKKAVEADPTFLERTRPLAEFLQTSFQAEENGDPITIRHIVSDEIFSSEHCDALMLHYVEHPQEFQRLATLSPREIAREMAKLEARFDAAPTATASKPQVSKAHDPVRPVAGAPSIADAVPGEESSYEEHKRYYDAQDRKKAASRR